MRLHLLSSLSLQDVECWLAVASGI